MLVKRLAAYSKLLVENCDIFLPQLCLAAPQGVTPSEFREELYTHKTRMNGLSCGEEIMSAVLIQCQRVTDGQTDRQTDELTHVKTEEDDGKQVATTQTVALGPQNVRIFKFKMKLSELII